MTRTRRILVGTVAMMLPFSAALATATAASASSGPSTGSIPTPVTPAGTGQEQICVGVPYPLGAPGDYLWACTPYSGWYGDMITWAFSLLPRH